MVKLPSLLGSEQQLLFDSAVQTLRRERQSDPASDEAVRRNWALCVELGWLSGCIAPDAEQPFLTACTLAEGHGYTGQLFPLGTACIAYRLTFEAGAGELSMPLAALREGRFVTVPYGSSSGMDTEVDATMETTDQGMELEVDGIFAPHAGTLAQIALVLANPPEDASSLFALAMSDADLRVDRLRTAAGAYIFKLSRPMRPSFAPVATGLSVLHASQRQQLYGAVLASAELAGIGRAALELTVDYAKGRVQFGRPIGSFQAVQHHLADMLRDLTAVRLLVAHTASRLDRGMPADREASMAKAKAAQAIPALLRMAHQITGGVGFYQDYPLEGFTRRAMDAVSMYGTAIEHRRQLAVTLREDPAAFRGPDAHP